MSSRRFLLSLPNDPYYAYIAYALKQALLEQGAKVQYCAIPAPNLLNIIDLEQLKAFVDSYQPTDVLSINVTKKQLQLPDHIIHHCWVQDPYACPVEDEGENCADHVWMAVSQWVDWWGGKPLLPATDYWRYHYYQPTYQWDISLAGYIPSCQFIIKDDPVLTEQVNKIQDNILSELLKLQNSFCKRDYAENLLQQAELKVGVQLKEDIKRNVISHVRATLARYAQRKPLVDFVVSLCQKENWKLALAGAGWEHFPNFKPYAIGFIPAGKNLALLFQNSKINLHTNGDSNVHPRVFECLSSGGFVLSQSHVTDKQKGGIYSIFSESTTPTFSDFKDLEDKLKYYINNKKARQQAIDEGRDIVCRFHTFRNRAEALITA